MGPAVSVAMAHYMLIPVSGALVAAGILAGLVAVDLATRARQLARMGKADQ